MIYTLNATSASAGISGELPVHGASSIASVRLSIPPTTIHPLLQYEVIEPNASKILLQT